MTVTQTLGPSGVRLITIDTTSGATSYELPPSPASGLTFKVRHVKGSVVATVTVASGKSIDDVVDATKSLPIDTEVTFESQDAGAWQSLGAGDPAGNYSPRLPSRGFTGLRAALDMGQSTAISIQGDSTGDSNGAAPADPGERVPYRFVQKIAARYSGHHVLSKVWDHTAQDYGAWTAVQTHALGRRHAAMTTRSLRYVAPTAAFVSGNLDLRILVSPTVWAPGSGGDRVLIARYRKADNTGNVLQFRWVLDQNNAMKVRWSTDGSNWGVDRGATVATAGTVDGTPMWLRMTLEINTSTGWTLKHYTSPATDGATWTQLGATVSAAGATSAMYAAEGNANPPVFEIGGAEWQPAANPLAGKIYEVQIRDGVGGPTVVPCCPETWQRYPDSATTFGGAPTLYLINGSRATTAMSYHTDSTRLPLMTQDYGQSMHIYNTGHNEVGASGPADWLTPYAAWVAAVASRLPRAAVVAVGQNPHTSDWTNEAAYGYSHQQRIKELASLATTSNWGYVDLYSAYQADPRGVTALIASDGLHPNNAGYELSALNMMNRLGYPS